MSKHLNKQQWLKVIEISEYKGLEFAAVYYQEITGKIVKEKDLKYRIWYKSILLDNKGMKIFKRKKGSGRPPKWDNSDIPGIIDDLTQEQLREIAEDWIREKRKKNDSDKLSNLKKLSKQMKSRILNVHRTTLYKKQVIRTYKYDFLRHRVTEIFNECKNIYGSRKISILLGFEGIYISDRTLRNYMVRWGLFTLTRRKKRKAESKNTLVKYKDIVKRNYNPVEDNIVATDVSYIPANVNQNFLYLSATISHKTKRIESWKLSERNDTQLVLDTINKLNRKNFILHSDHGTQYSSIEVIKKLKEINAITSISRIGNSLDNREIEYFFGCLKGEYLNNINTKNMTFHEINRHIAWYIKWYNTKRIQKKLNWKTPAHASVVSS